MFELFKDLWKFFKTLRNIQISNPVFEALDVIVYVSAPDKSVENLVASAFARYGMRVTNNSDEATHVLNYFVSCAHLNFPYFGAIAITLTSSHERKVVKSQTFPPALTPTAEDFIYTVAFLVRTWLENEKGQ